MADAAPAPVSADAFGDAGAATPRRGAPPPHPGGDASEFLPAGDASGRRGRPARAPSGDPDALIDAAWATLEEQLRGRFDAWHVEAVERAYRFARDAHRGVTRTSGEPYITHPIAVAGIVAELGLDAPSVMAALLHDVLEDTRTPRAELVERFGEDVAHMVDGVSKLTDVEGRTKEEAQAGSFRKMLLAMVTDIRVILIKLADRLHNMRTIGALRPDKQRRIGRETLEVYAPIATRLGMFTLKNELEDLGFRACYPTRHRVLEAAVQQTRRHRTQLVAKVASRVETALEERGIEAVVTGREKHLYSLYSKMHRKQLTFQRVMDVFGLRVVVDSVDDCYRTLGIVHRLHPPLFQRFKDYIAVPKENGYRSIHTTLNHAADGTPLEVQIRTKEMDAFAESGIAAHWAYKSGEAGGQIANDRAAPWLAELIGLEERTLDTVEFVENAKIDLSPGSIYVFTPKGRIVQLPRGATPVDFAYAVHSDIGNRCVSAKVDRRLASLSEPLAPGVTVEITTRKGATPSPMWLHSVVTGKARTAIRQKLRALDRNKAEAFGVRLLRRALAGAGIALDDVTVGQLETLLGQLKLEGPAELYMDLGLGLLLPSTVATRLARICRGDDAAAVAVRDAPPLLVESPDDPVLSLSKCCRPIPGDAIKGFFAPGTGVAVHRVGCRNANRFRRKKKEAVAVKWSPHVRGAFEVVILVHLANRPGALARVTSTMSLLDVNIEDMDFDKRADDSISIRFVLAVEGRSTLARIVRKLRNLTVVRFVRRES